MFKGLRPTPELSYSVRYNKAIGGIMITASHNPKEYNGYKIYNSEGCQLVPDDANMVIDEINKIENIFDVKYSKNDDGIIFMDEKIDEDYIKDIETIQLNPNLKKDFKITFTPLHGTGSVLTSQTLKSLGYDVYPVKSQMVNDPDFSAVKSSNPENKEAFDEAINLAKEIGAKLVLATDPDADRLGVAVLHNGVYQLMTGNESATVLFKYIVDMNKKKNIDLSNSYLFTTIVSSMLPVEIAKKYGMKYDLTLTGFKFIGQKAKEIEGKGRYLFGYEESYGCLIKDSVRDKDSIQACIMLCEAAAYYYSLGLDLIDQLENIYKEYGYVKDGITNFVLKGLEGQKQISRIMDFFRENEIKLNSFAIIQKDDIKKSISYDLINNKSTNIDLPKSNVIKYFLADGSWFVLRPSGTEPKLKVYYSLKGKTEIEAQTKLDKLSKEVCDIVNNIK
jgi:phosphoglucomutase